MHLTTLTYSRASKWSVYPLPQLDSPRTMIIVFGASQFIDMPAPLRELAAAYPSSHLIGCSTSGEIAGAQVYDDTLSVAILQFEATTLKSITLPITFSGSMVTMGKQISEMTEAVLSELQCDGLRGIFLLGSGLDFNFDWFMREFNKHLDPDVVVTGGVAGDGDRFARTWILKEGIPTERYISAVGFYGDHIELNYGSNGGWQLSGIPMLITRSENNILYELNGRSALRLYKLYLRDQVANLPASALLYPLAIKQSSNTREHIVRTVLGIDEKKGAMIFAGDIPRMSFAQFMRANPYNLIDGATAAAGTVSRELTAISGPVLSIAISCVGRRLVLKDQTYKELDAVVSVLPQNVQQIGFYSYGEISPALKSGFSNLHNQTMTLTSIRERLN